MYKFNALVIDDERQINELIVSCQNILQKKYDISINFNIVNNSNEYNENIIYDLLLVDFDLSNSFKLPNIKNTGDYYIKEVRKKNKFCKIIFYSSNFTFNNKTKSINLDDDLIFDLINNYSVDSIVDKNNTKQLVEEIKKNCENIDYFPLVLSKIYEEYQNEGLEFEYTINGKSIKSNEMIENILKNNETGMSFRKQILDSFIQNYMKIRY